jgi:hypothetical protein
MKHLQKNWLGWTAAFVILLVLFNVEQVRHLFELPPIEAGKNWAIFASFYVYIAAIAVLYFFAGWWIIPYDPARLANDPSPLEQRIDHRITVWRHAIVFINVALGAAIIALSCIVDGPYLLDKSVLRTFGILFLLFGGTVFSWPWMQIWTKRLWLKSLLVLLAFNVLGEALWFLGNEHAWFSPRNYSLWAFLHLFFCIFLIARVADVWQNFSGQPIRIGVIVLIVVAIGWSGPTRLGVTKTAIAASTPSDAVAAPENGPASVPDNQDNWLAWVKKKLETMPADGPVILVAASGGGSRAALFTGLIYEELENLSDNPQALNGYQPSKHILMISSVSGGTLASSCWLDAEYTKRRHDEGKRNALRNSFDEEMMQLIPLELASLKSVPFYRRMSESGTVVADFVALAEQSLQSGQLPVCCLSPLSDDLCTDFMAPLMRGALHPGRDRSQSVSQFWNTRFGMRETNLQWGGRTLDQAELLSPLLLCNVCEVERGSRLIIGFPPLPAGLLGRRGERSARSWEDLDTSGEETVEISLGEATRLSANFPWGFPVGAVTIHKADSNGRKVASEIHLIDGGVCDNTGIDSLRYVIEALRKWEDSEPKTDLEKSRKDAAGEILDTLRQRGVLLLEIDSGAKPEAPGFLATSLSGILEPVSALQNASYASATAAIDTHLAVLNDALPSSQAEQLTERLEKLWIRGSQSDEELEISRDSLVNVKRLTITCNHQDNVMTAWALGPTDKAQVFARFLAGSERFRYELNEYLKEYQETRSGLRVLEDKIAALESQGTADPTVLRNLVEARNDLFASSVAVKKLASLRVSAEKMFYQGVPLPDEVIERVSDEVRTSSKWKSKLPNDVVPDPTGPTPDQTPVEPEYGQNVSPQKFEQLQNAAQSLEENVKGKRRQTLERIQQMKP